MSENTPIYDSLRRIRAEGLNGEATAELARMAYEQLIADMPEHFDRDGDAIKHRLTVIATDHVPYFRDNGSI